MKVLLLAKNFHDGDEVSEHLKALSEYLVDEGHEATILSFDDGKSYSVSEGVDVDRVSMYYEGDSLYSWVMMLNNELKKKAREYINREDVELVHAHDWAAVPTATAVKQRFEVPVVFTLHSTENERGFESSNAEVISELEWKGAYQAEKLFVNRKTTYESVKHDLDVPETKITKLNPLNHGWQEKVVEEYGKMIDKNKKQEKVEVES